MNYRSSNIKSIKHGSIKNLRHKKAFGLFASSVIERFVCVCSMWTHLQGGVGATEGIQDAEVGGGGWARAAGWRWLQSCLFQVVEVWHARSGRASEAVPVLAPLDAHLLRVRVALGPPQGGRVPAGLQLARQWVASLSALELRCADPWVTPAFREAALTGGRVRQRLVAHVGGCGLVRGGWWQV